MASNGHPPLDELPEPLKVPAILELIGRWKRTLDRVQSRFERILVAAVSGSEHLIQSVRSDLTPLTQAWEAVAGTLKDYTDQVEARWAELEEELGTLNGVTDETRDEQRHEADRVICELELQYVRAYRSVMARAAQGMRRWALESDARGQRCTQCGDTLDDVVPLPLGLGVECGRCRAVSVLEPSDAVKAFAGAGLRFLAEREALEAWEEVRRLGGRIRGYEERQLVPRGLLEAFRDACREYWETLLAVEAAYLPGRAEAGERRLQQAMAFVDDRLAKFPGWTDDDSPAPSGDVVGP